MKTCRFSFYLFVWLVSCTVLFSCSEDEQIESGHTEEPDKEKPEVTGEASKYVPLDWDKTEIEQLDLETGEVMLAFSDDVPQIEDGLSVMVLETDTSAYIRRIMQSTVEGNTVRLQTIEAKMTELFSDTEFSISLAPSEARAETRTGSITSIDGNGVLHPVKIVELNGDGTYQTLYDAKKQSRVDIGVGSQISLFNLDLSGKIIGASSGGHIALSWESFKQQIFLDVDAYFKFTKPIRDVELNEHLKIKVSELEDCHFIFGGNVLSEMIIRADMNGEFAYTPEPLKLGGFNPKVYTFITPVGVPVVFTLSSDLFAQISVDGKSENVARAGVTATGGFDLGVEYEGNSKWSPVTSVNYDYDVIPLEIKGKSELNAKASLYPEMKLKLYDFLGPIISPKVYVRDEFRLGFFDQFGSVSDDYYAWTEKLFAGVDLSIDLGLEFIDWEVSPIPLYNGNLLDKQFYNAPDDIKLVSPASGSGATVGEEIPVRFNVTRELMGISFPAMDVSVKFESEGGKCNYDFVPTGLLGNADVLWTPSSKNAILTAKIFDENGNVIAEASFAPNLEEEESKDLLIGEWELVNFREEGSPTTPGWNYGDFIIRADGTFSTPIEYVTPTTGWWYRTDDYQPNSFVIYYEYDGETLGLGFIILELTETTLRLYSFTEENEGGEGQPYKGVYLDYVRK